MVVRAWRPLVAEGRDHQVGGAVHDFRRFEEVRRRVDEAAEAHDALHLVEVAERDLEMGEKVDRAGARCLLPVLDRDRATELADRKELPSGPKQSWPDTTRRLPVRTKPT